MARADRAAAWLSALEAELWHLASDEREAVLAELRGHLAARAEAGALEEALAALGDPAALAAAYDFAGPRHGTIAALPGEFTHGESKSVRGLLRDVRATLRASRNGLPLVGALLVTSLTATDFLLWTASRLPWVGIDVAPPMALRIVAVLLALSAAYRLALSRTERPWSMDRGFFAFAGALGLATVATVAAALAVGRTAGALAHGLAAADAIRRGAGLAMLALASMALLRVQPWLAALASRREGFGLGAAWRGTRGRMATIAGAWAMLVLPLYLLHAFLNLLAMRVLPFGAGLLALAALDAIACAGIVVGAVMLNAAVLRWIAGEPVPAPSPFSTDRPEPELVDAARARLAQLLRPALNL
jgi:hypothetical protein